MPLVDKAFEEGKADSGFSNYVILGNGPAGISALLAILEVDPDGEVAIVSPEVERYYSKILLTYWIGGKTDLDDVFLVDEDFYEKNGVRPLLGVGASRVDPIGKVVELEDGRRLAYNSLLLAMGSSPQVPDIPGATLSGVYSLRTLEDAKKIKEKTPTSKRAVVLGGGLVSIKTVEGLLARGIDVVLVVTSGRLLSQITAPEDQEVVFNMFQVPGLDIRLRCDAAAIEGDGEVERVRLSTGEVIDCDMVVIGKGVSPNLSSIKGTEIEAGFGILVNDRMETNVPNVYAAGDIAEGHDRARGKHWVNALWSSAVWQGRVAGYNMAGRRVSYPGDVGLNSVSFGDKSLITLGKIRPEEGDEAVLFLDRRRKEYRRLVFSDGRLVGAVISGPSTQAAGVLRSLIARGEDTAGIRNVLLGARLSYGDVVHTGTRLSYCGPLG